MSMAGPRRSWEAERGQRTYRCRRCRHAADDFYLPDGWLQVRVRDPQATPGENTYRIVGLYCTAACLAAEAGGWAAAVEQAEAAGR